MGLGDLTRMMGQFKDMQANMQRMQEELAQKRVQADSGGGMVTATVNGKGELVDLHIDPECVDPADPGILEEMVLAAVNAAITKSHEQMKDEMMKLTGGMNLPGMDQLQNLFGG